MKAIACLLLALPLAANACDWTVKRTVDPMTSQAKCLLMSPSAHIGVAVQDGAILFVSPSNRGAYDGLRMRVDENPAILLAEDARSTHAVHDDARRVWAQIQSGKRLRVDFQTYRGTVSGDAEICTLPDLVASCLH